MSGESYVLLIQPSGFVGAQDEPCLNNGSCQITWNDFNCSCPADFSGRLCETRLWCVNRPCFHGAHCVDLPDGYECKSSLFHSFVKTLKLLELWWTFLTTIPSRFRGKTFNSPVESSFLLPSPQNFSYFHRFDRCHVSGQCS